MKKRIRNTNEELTKNSMNLKKLILNLTLLEKKMGIDAKVSIKDMVDDYGEFLPDTDRNKLSTIL